MPFLFRFKNKQKLQFLLHPGTLFGDHCSRVVCRSGDQNQDLTKHGDSAVLPLQYLASGGGYRVLTEQAPPVIPKQIKVPLTGVCNLTFFFLTFSTAPKAYGNFQATD